MELILIIILFVIVLVFALWAIPKVKKSDDWGHQMATPGTGWLFRHTQELYGLQNPSSGNPTGGGDGSGSGPAPPFG